MKKASTKHSLKPLPKLERLLLDTDVDAHLAQYLRAVGFSVSFAAKVKVDYRDDAAIVKWARRNSRIVVCHDRYKDRKTKIKVYQEIYSNGGQVIQVGGGPGQDPLTSLGKILAHRKDWLEFFQDNDGMVLVHRDGMTRMPRMYLRKQIQGQLGEPVVPVVAPKSPRPRRVTRRKPKPIPPEQQPLLYQQ